MKYLITGWAFVLLLSGPVAGAPRDRVWKDHDGNETKAQFTGVLEGRVVLRQDRKRMYVRLSSFCLKDRDYIVELLKSRKQTKSLVELMAFENQTEAAINARTQPGAAGLNGIPGNAPAVPGGLSRNPGGIGSGLVVPPKTKNVYGLQVPSPGLLEEDPLRRWTDLSGGQVAAVFEQIVEPKHFRLRMPDGSVKDLAMVNFVKEDMDYVQDLLKRDWERPVFPEGGGGPLTVEESGKGYRTWTDRKGEKLNGKFVSLSDKKVTLEVADGQQTYPMFGLSEEDQAWINTELARRAEEARRKAEAARAANGGGGSSFGPRSPFDPPRSRFGPGSSNFGPGSSSFGPGSMPRMPRMPSRPTYQFNCEHCGRSWTGSSPISRCSNCSGKYHFRCHRCGHKWSNTVMFDKCPSCSGNINNNGGGSSNSGGGHSDGSSYNNRSSSSPYGGYSPPTPNVPSMNNTSSSETASGSSDSVWLALKIIGGLGFTGLIVFGIVQMVNG